MNAMLTELWPYLLLILVGFLPNEVWRALGLVLARGLNEESELVVLSRAIATAILAGVIAKLILFSAGALVAIPLPVRVGAAMCGFLGFFRHQAFDLRRCSGRRSCTARRGLPVRIVEFQRCRASARGPYAMSPKWFAHWRANFARASSRLATASVRTCTSIFRS